MCEFISSHKDHKMDNMKLSQRVSLSLLKRWPRRIISERDHRFVGKVNGHPKLWEIKAQEDLEKEHEKKQMTVCFGVIANLKIDIPVNILHIIRSIYFYGPLDELGAFVTHFLRTQRTHWYNLWNIFCSSMVVFVTHILIFSERKLKTLFGPFVRQSVFSI